MFKTLFCGNFFYPELSYTDGKMSVTAGYIWYLSEDEAKIS